MLDAEVVVAPGEAKSDAEIDVGFVHAAEEVVGGGDLGFGVGVHFGEGGITFEVVFAIVADGRGEDVCMEVDNHVWI